jgi:hypothetical protein
MYVEVKGNAKEGGNNKSLTSLAPGPPPLQSSEINDLAAREKAMREGRLRHR